MDMVISASQAGGLAGGWLEEFVPRIDEQKR